MQILYYLYFHIKMTKLFALNYAHQHRYLNYPTNLNSLEQRIGFFCSRNVLILIRAYNIGIYAREINFMAEFKFLLKIYCSPTRY